MPVSADTLALLVAKGLTGADLVEVVRAIDADAAAARPAAGAMSEKAKVGAAARMARYRETRRSLGLDPHFSGRAVMPALRDRDGEGCIYCGADATTVDHIIPTSQGGCDDFGNLGLACNQCNGGKAGRTPQQAGMKIVSETAEAAHVRYCSERTVRGEQGEQSPPSPPPKRYNQTPSSSPQSSLRSERNREREGFADFWSVVPRKTGKDAAEKAYRRIVAGGRAVPAEILAGAIRWRDESRGDDPQFVPHPATWLNRGGWEDEPRAQQPRAGPPRRGGQTVSDMARMNDEPEMFDDQHQPHPRDRTAQGAEPADPGRRGFAGRLSFEDAAFARRGALVDH